MRLRSCAPSQDCVSEYQTCTRKHRQAPEVAAIPHPIETIGETHLLFLSGLAFRLLLLGFALLLLPGLVRLSPPLLSHPRQVQPLVSDSPEALIASVAWVAGDGQVTVMNVWDDPEAIANLFIERTRPIIEEMGEPAEKPKRHGQPLEVYIRR